MERPLGAPTLAQALAAMPIAASNFGERQYTLDDFLPDIVLRDIAKIAENYLRNKWMPPS